MAKRVFTEEERTEYREKMLAAGFDLCEQIPAGKTKACTAAGNYCVTRLYFNGRSR